MLPLVTGDTADPVEHFGVGRLHGLRRDPSASGLRRFAEQVVRLSDVRQVGLELLPLEARLHHPLLDVVPQLVERNVHRADFLAGAAAGTLPRVPRKVFSGLHLTAQQQVQGSAHLVLAEGEDATTRRSALPACLLIRWADGDTIAAHRAGVDIFLNRRHLREARHSIPPFRSEVPRVAGPLGPPVLLRPVPAPRGRPSRGRPCEPRTRQTGSPTCVRPPRQSPTPWTGKSPSQTRSARRRSLDTCSASPSFRPRSRTRSTRPSRRR